jgi:hypothetical protein
MMKICRQAYAAIQPCEANDLDGREASARGLNGFIFDSQNSFRNISELAKDAAPPRRVKCLSVGNIETLKREFETGPANLEET